MKHEQDKEWCGSCAVLGTGTTVYGYESVHRQTKPSLLQTKTNRARFKIKALSDLNVYSFFVSLASEIFESLFQNALNLGKDG